jgi:alcohol dehydrogenase class IV
MKSFDAGRVPPLTFGAGRLAEVPGIVRGLASDDGPVLVVADRLLVDLGPAVDLERALSQAGIGVEMAADIAGEPKDALVDQLADRARTNGCSSVIGLGGGAAMDAAKLVACVAGSDQPAVHYALSANPYPERTLPAIAIPTTAGTGSEVTRTAIVSNAAGAKHWYWSEDLMFVHAVLDPELTLTLPPHVTAWTGIDAVAHALEAVTSRSSNGAGRLFGLQALEMLARGLPQAVADGSDLEARAEVLWASTVAGLALHNCNTHMGHNISHALGSLAPVHHGLATGLALEVTLPDLVARPEGRENYALAAAALGASGYANSLPKAFSDLLNKIGIASALPSVCSGVSATDLAAEMKAPANFGMSQNAACDLGESDLDRFAAAMLDLPAEEIAA